MNAGDLRPVILAVDPDPATVARVQHELDSRYGHDYEVACETSFEAAEARLNALVAAKARLAVSLISNAPGHEIFSPAAAHCTRGHGGRSCLHRTTSTRSPRRRRR